MEQQLDSQIITKNNNQNKRWMKIFCFVSYNNKNIVLEI
jgi:hypothetical protein